MPYVDTDEGRVYMTGAHYAQYLLNASVMNYADWVGAGSPTGRTVTLTQAEYDGIASPDESTLFVVAG